MTDTTVLPPFTVSRAAVEAIERLGGAVRVDLEQGGCCGTAYAFSLVDPDADAVAGDDRFGCAGAWLFVSPRAAEVLDGATLDYGASLKPPRFRVPRNPNVEHVCACRRSFGNPWPGPRQPTCWSYRPMPWDDDYEPPQDWARRTGWSRDRAARSPEETVSFLEEHAAG